MIDLDSDYEKARSRALRLLTVRGRSREELKGRLAAAGFSELVADQVVQRLVEVGLLDDDAFANDVVERAKLKGLATLAVRRNLQASKVPPDVVDRALEEYGSEDRVRATEIARRKVKTLHRLGRDVAYRRLTGFLAGKGFDAEIVSETCRQALGESFSVIDPAPDEV